MTEPKSSRQRHTVLVVDDDLHIQTALANLLAREGFDVATASSSAQAFEIISARQPCVALIDIMMPGINGLDFCRELKAEPRTADIQIILISAMSDTEAVRAGIEAGAADYIKKPFDREEMMFRVWAQVRLHDSLQAQRHAQERLSLISRAAKDAIVLLDGEEQISHWNEAAESIFGYCSKEVLGRPLEVLIAPEAVHIREHVEFQPVRSAQADESEGQILELLAVRKSGDLFHMELTLSTAHLDGSRWTLCVIRDVTERRSRESQLQSLATAIEQAAETVVITDPNGSIRYCNPAFERVSGYKAKEALGQNPRILSSGEESPEFYSNLWNTIKRGNVWSGHFRNRKKDGSLYEEEATISPIQEKSGQISGFVAVKRDVTDRVRLEKERLSIEQKLRASESRLRTILENVPVGIAIVGTDRRIRWANRAAVNMVDAPDLDEILGKPCNEVLCQFRDGLCPFFDSDETVPSAETVLLRADGTSLPVLKSAHAVEFGDELVRLETFVDLRERKRLEAELGQARKLESVGQLAAGIAHEINTPIQYVGDSTQFLQESFEGFSRLIPRYRQAMARSAAGNQEVDLTLEVAALEQELDLDWLMAEVPGSFNRCMEGIRRVARIVQAMKEFAHPDQGQKSPADLNHALDSTLTISRNEHKFVAEVITEFTEIPPVVCRVSELNQAFLNIIVNAAHAITAVVGNSGKMGRIIVGTSCLGGHVRITISDTGCGIPDAIRDRIFDPFFTTKPVGKGTGQGLAIARSIIVDKHGGTLTVDSPPGQGTTFVILLPING